MVGTSLIVPLRTPSLDMGSASAVRERISFVPHPKTLTAAGELEYFAARVRSSALRSALSTPLLSCRLPLLQQAQHDGSHERMLPFLISWCGRRAIIRWRSHWPSWWTTR